MYNLYGLLFKTLSFISIETMCLTYCFSLSFDWIFMLFSQTIFQIIFGNYTYLPVKVLNLFHNLIRIIFLLDWRKYYRNEKKMVTYFSLNFFFFLGGGWGVCYVADMKRIETYYYLDLKEGLFEWIFIWQYFLSVFFKKTFIL